MRKAYCRDCKHYYLDFDEIMKCAKAKEMDTYLEPIKIPPHIKNMKNDCKDFVKK